MPWTKARPPFPSLVDLSIGAGGKGFEISSQRRFRGEGGDPSEIRGDLMIEKMKALRLVERELAVGFGFQPVQKLVELGPRGPLGGDEARKVDDHGMRLIFS